VRQICGERPCCARMSSRAGSTAHHGSTEYAEGHGTTAQRRSLDQEIDDVPSCDLDAFVLDGQSELAAIGVLSQLQLAAEPGVIRGL